MSQFVFLYRGVDRSRSEEMQQNMQKWMAWIKELSEQGHLKDMGQPLEYTGKVVKGKQNRTVTDGPYSETKEIVAGYTLIEAKDLEQAAELSMGCPIFERGGFVEVRPVLTL
jgi:hypothetical protein